ARARGHSSRDRRSPGYVHPAARAVTCRAGRHAQHSVDVAPAGPLEQPAAGRAAHQRLDVPGSSVSGPEPEREPEPEPEPEPWNRTQGTPGTPGTHGTVTFRFPTAALRFPP